jgi:hypothetical protein
MASAIPSELANGRNTAPAGRTTPSTAIRPSGSIMVTASVTSYRIVHEQGIRALFVLCIYVRTKYILSKVFMFLY